MPSGIIDPRTGAIVVVTGDHHYIHEGISYVLAGNTASIAAAGVEHISFKTPPISVGVIHFRPAKLSSSANSLSVTMIEGAVMSGGNAAIPRNNNRLKKDASKVVIATAANITTAGTATIYNDSVGTGGTSNRAGGDSASGEERILKPDTTYSITFTNTGTVTATIGTYTLFWYEEAK